MKYYHYPRFSRLYVVSHDSVLYKILDFVLLSGVEYCKYLRIFEISISIHGDSRIYKYVILRVQPEISKV